MTGANSTGAESPKGALSGIRVIELARVAPAEFPGMMMSDMGADVLKIDSPESVVSRSEDADRELIHAHTNRNKRSIALDLKSPAGRQVLHKLAKDADVLVEGFRPGVMARLGAGYDELRELNPRLIYCSLSSFGKDGPYRDRPAHDMNFMALSGALGMIGEPDRPPVVPLNLVADLGGASMHGVAGILAALFARERTGRGQHVDISYLDTTLALLGASINLRTFFSKKFVTAKGEGIGGLTYPFYSCYETLDGRLLSVACSETPLWINFCNAIGRPDLAAVTRAPDTYLRSANKAEVAAREEVAKVIRSKDMTHWERTLATANVCYARVNTMEEAVADPQILHRNMVTSVQHPRWGSVGHFGPAVKFSETPARIRSAAPLPGEHTRQILVDLGYSEDEIRNLHEKGVAPHVV